MTSGGPVGGTSPRLEPDRPTAQAFDRRHVVAHEQDRSPARRGLAHLAHATPLELGVAHGQHLVDDQDVRQKRALTWALI
jgi:hypothetical protein